MLLQAKVWSSILFTINLLKEIFNPHYLTKMNLEKHFAKFRENTIGNDATFMSPYGEQKIIYADWIASGRLYSPIEKIMQDKFGPMVGNTHSEASETGVTMTFAYSLAQKIIKQHVNANEDDIIISAGSGMTRLVSKLQRILGLKVPDSTSNYCSLAKVDIYNCTEGMGNKKPIVFISHMEHHSNHTSWLETIADVVVVPPDDNLLVSPENLKIELEKYKSRELIIGSFSAGSNVTGIIPPYKKLCKLMHQYNGLCFLDFAATAPYKHIDMHPANDPDAYIDAVMFSPHKFLGGPGSAGVLIFNKEMYKSQSPDNPGGGTVTWTNRWQEFNYYDNIEIREDGGTPAFLQTIRTALSIKLKEQMGVENMHNREKELLEIAFSEMKKIDEIKILASHVEDRIGAFSFFVKGVHHNLVVKLMNDRFGIQVRGGCSCAGTYGHFLLNVDKHLSDSITSEINSGDLSHKPGWIRLSIHPTTTNNELLFIINSLKQIIKNVNIWRKDYYFSTKTGEWYHNKINKTKDEVLKWFDIND